MLNKINSGFTLIELITVIVIIAIPAALLIPLFAKKTDNKFCDVADRYVEYCIEDYEKYEEEISLRISINETFNYMNWLMIHKKRRDEILKDNNTLRLDIIKSNESIVETDGLSTHKIDKDLENFDIKLDSMLNAF